MRALTAHVASVGALALENLVDPHVLVQVEGANEDFVRLLRTLHIVAQTSFQKCNCLFAVVTEASALLFELFLTIACEYWASEGHLSWALTIDQVCVRLELFDSMDSACQWKD